MAHAPKSDDRHRLKQDKGRQLLACMTNLVPEHHTMALLPEMSRVKHGTEPLLAGQPLWDCTASPAVCYQSLLEKMAVHMLSNAAKYGKPYVSGGIEQFMYPQTFKANSVHDSTCHMAAKGRFPLGSPFQRSCSLQCRGSWYTWVFLGKSGKGVRVKLRAHVIIAAARFGVPDSMFDSECQLKELAQACHTPSRPMQKGGCCNPLHIRWDTPRSNFLDHGLKMKSKLKGVHTMNMNRARKHEAAAGSQAVSSVSRRVTRSQAKQGSG